MTTTTPLHNQTFDYNASYAKLGPAEMNSLQGFNQWFPFSSAPVQDELFNASDLYVFIFLIVLAINLTH
jgi:hypothetical protein